MSGPPPPSASLPPGDGDTMSWVTWPVGLSRALLWRESGWRFYGPRSVSPKWQITVPTDMREDLGLETLSSVLMWAQVDHRAIVMTLDETRIDPYTPVDLPSPASSR